ncbi:otoferlin-like [Babylonia areolata]|uniref:otoferlin-like n=1 Tax=Babylonia areolata TaxID=304850 RepID=UPI003FD0073A
MALVLHLKYVENLRGRGDRLAKVSFRGVSHFTKIVENAEESVLFEETFEWPVARPVEAEEIIDIQIYNYNKYLSNKLVGTFRMILQQLVEVGNLKISDCLLDANNVVMQTNELQNEPMVLLFQTKVTFELTYNAPDGSVGSWQTGGFEKLASDEYRRPLSEEERNQLNLERSIGGDGETEGSLATSPSRSVKGSTLSLASRTSTKSSSKSPKPSGKLSAVVKMSLLSRKHRPSTVSSGEADIVDDDNRTLCGENDFDSAESNDLDARAAEVASMLAATAQQTVEDDNASEQSTVPGAGTGKRARLMTSSEDLMMKAQDFQVCVTIIEARQLAGLNMDPVVCVQVGDTKKYTSVKESTNCPYYNEYFVFDFHMPPIMLFDKIITLTVLHSRNFLRSGNTVGCFKLDVATACHSGRLLRMTKPVGSYKLDVATVYAQTENMKCVPSSSLRQPSSTLPLWYVLEAAFWRSENTFSDFVSGISV